MIFHATPLSSYSAKVRIVLCVKSVPYEERAPPGGYRSEEYRAIVPMGTCRRCRIGDWVLSESEAINEYLDESYPSRRCCRATLRGRARIRFPVPLPRPVPRTPGACAVCPCQARAPRCAKGAALRGEIDHACGATRGLGAASSPLLTPRPSAWPTAARW
jgi:hypothetical protein